MTDAPARLTAALIALIALLAMIPPLANSAAEHGGLLMGMWLLARYFTILTNLLVGIAFARIALNGREAVPPVLLGGAMLAIMLVGAVFNLLLGHLPYATMWDMLGDKAHHAIVPLAVPLWWLAFAPKGALSWRAPLRWTLYPLAYSAYILLRAWAEGAGEPGRYPYFFLDVDRLGWPAAFANLGGLALGFVLAGLAVVWLDRRLGAKAALT
jgi:hypothetical protein